MLAFKQPPNLRKMLCRAKLPTQNQAKRKLKGVKPCNQPCNLCPYIKTSKEFSSSQSKEIFKINDLYTCNTKGVIYLTTCSQCNKQYVGQTGRKLKERMKEHLYNVYKKQKLQAYIILSQAILTGTSKYKSLKKYTQIQQIIDLKERITE
jgi:hypothetical protein